MNGFVSSYYIDGNSDQRSWFSSTTGSDVKEEKEEGTEEKADSKTEEVEEPQGPSFEEQIMALEGSVKTLKDQLLRSLAEQENTRHIARRDVEAAKNFAIKSFAKSLLEVSDNLNRALDAVPVDALDGGDNNNNNNNNNSLKTLYEGVKMTNDGLTKALESNGIRAFTKQPGEVFDPTRHEALMEYLDPSKEPGTVGLVLKVGFTLNDRVLRPAEVGVVKKP
jgi:molecular chaperone GrpE